MNKYDQLMYIILKRILSCFGIRILNHDKVKYLFKVRNYASPEKREYGHVIHLSSDVTEVFGFLKMDYKKYKKQHFKTTFEFVDWVTKNCRYLTVDIVKSLAKDVKGIPLDKMTEVEKALSTFCESIKIGHVVLRDFQYAPIIMYPNLRESIVRRYFNTQSVEEQFVSLKMQYLGKDELQYKFSPKLVVTWIHPLRSDSTLTGLFTSSFVNYITQYNTNKFPRFLVDNEVDIIRKEVLSYYYNIFPQTETYRKYILSKGDKNEVKK